MGGNIMKFKKICILAVCMMMVLTLTGCGNKTVLTKEDFVAKAENNDLVIGDATDQYSS